jgi:membrane-associated protein
MDLAQFVDVFLHLDKHLEAVVAQYGAWVYALLFAIIFVETGLVVMPFLPGDSLLFVCGALAAIGALNLPLLMVLLVVAAVLGDALNYAIGRHVGPRVWQWEQSRFFNRAAFDRTHAFYEKHGAITIIVARFLPFVRTFAPFVAGVGTMPYRIFLFWNVAGAFLWVGSFIYAGYAFGDLPVVRENFTLLILGIIVVSVMPVVIEAIKAWRGARA